MLANGVLKLGGSGVIQLRGGTSEVLREVNPLLSRREIMCEVDTGRTKVGDGTRRWNELEYTTQGKVSYMNVTLSDEHVEQKYVELAEECEELGAISVAVQGILTERGVDFELRRNKEITWDGLGLEGIVRSGDKIFITYTKKG